jgi:hypothetical protein
MVMVMAHHVCRVLRLVVAVMMVTVHMLLRPSKVIIIAVRYAAALWPDLLVYL